MKILKIQTEINEEIKSFDINDFDIEKANGIGLDCNEYSLKIASDIKKGLSEIFGYEVFSLEVYNISQWDFDNKMAGGYGDCMWIGNLSNNRVSFDAFIV